MYTYEIEYLVKDERGGQYTETFVWTQNELDTEKVLDEFIQQTEQPTNTILEIKVFNRKSELIDIIN